MVANDGKYRFSEVVKLNLPGWQALVLAPNPASDRVKISGLSSGSNHITLSNAVGKQLWSVSVQGQGEYDIDLTGMAGGIYFIHIRNEYGQQEVLRLVKE